jgi:uncharacterized UPF0146 family protein
MTDGARPVFAVPFSWESAVGHVVELLVEHVEPGLVVEIGAGRAPAAERLRQRGYEYAAVVESAAEVDGLAARGFHSSVADLADPAQVVRAVDELVAAGSSPGRALLLVDVVERCAAPDTLLTSLRRWADAHPGVLVGASAANVAHRSVAVTLMNGRFRPLTAGPHHHTREDWTDRFAAAGFAERRRFDLVGADVDEQPSHDPAVSRGAQLGAFLTTVRSRADAHADTTRFVSLFEPSRRDLPASAASEVASLAIVVAADRADHFTTRNAPHLGADVALATFTDDDDLAAVIDSSTSPYVVFVDGGEQVGPDWVAQFVGQLRWHPGSIIRCASLDDRWPAHSSQYALLAGPTAPSAAFALPTAAVHRAVERPRYVDGSFDLLPLLLEVAPLCGVVDSGVGALSAPDGWQRSTGAEVGVADDAAYLGPPGSRRFLAGLVSPERATLERIAHLEAENAVLRAQLGRRSVRLATTAADGLRRLGRFLRRG